MNKLVLLTFWLSFLLVTQAGIAQINCTLDLGNDTVYCGNPITFNAGSGYHSYSWNTGSTNASINATSPGIYAVTVTSIGQSAVVNGNFQAGNSGFFCSYVYNPVSVWNEGTYAIVNNANLVHSNFHGLDHTNPPSGNFLVCNGSGVAGTIIWQQTVNVIPGIQYQFSTWITTLVASNPALIQFYINGVPFGPIFPAPATASTWIQFFTIWLSGTSTTATISIVNQNTVLSGNDFGIDDIYFAPVIPCVDSVVVNMPTLASQMTAVNVACFGESTGQANLLVNNGYQPYTFVWNNGTTTQSLSGVPAGNYSVTITDAATCYIMDSVEIDEPNLPLMISYSKEDVNCAGEQDGYIDLTVSGGVAPYSYNWGFSTQQDLQNLSGNVYAVNITDAAGCIRQETIEINEPAALFLDLTYQHISCHGATDGLVEAIVAGGVPDYTYQWNQGQANYAITNLTAGFYSLTVFDEHGCSVKDSVVLIEPAEIQLYTSPDKTICLSESAEIITNAIGGTLPYQFFWDPGGLASNSLIVSPETSTQYCVQIKDARQCQSNIRCVSIFVNPPLELEVSLSEDTICKGDSIVIHSEVSGGNGGPYILEHSGHGSILSDYTFVPEFSQQILIYAYDGCGTPTVLETKYILLQDVPFVSFRSDLLEGCQPLPVQFINNNPKPDQKYEWSFEDAIYFNNSFEENPLFTFLNPGVYNVSLKVTNQLGCSSTLTHPGMIEVFPKPISNYSVSQTGTHTADPIVEFINQSVDAAGYLWAFGDGDSTNSVHPLPHFYTAAGEYLTSLIATSVNGCKDTSYIKVEISEYPSFYLPNAINPFSYLQQNRIFKPKGVFIGIEDYRMQIFNRWGDMIFYSDNPELGWDGKLSSGETAPQGSYAFIVEYKSAENTPITKSGNVHVIY